MSAATSDLSNELFVLRDVGRQCEGEAHCLRPGLNWKSGESMSSFPDSAILQPITARSCFARFLTGHSFERQRATPVVLRIFWTGMVSRAQSSIVAVLFRVELPNFLERSLKIAWAIRPLQSPGLWFTRHRWNLRFVAQPAAPRC